MNYKTMTDLEFRKHMKAVDAEVERRAALKHTANLKKFADSLVRVRDIKVCFHSHAQYVSATMQKKFAGGFFTRPGKKSHGSLFAKTKTGILYCFRINQKQFAKL